MTVAVSVIPCINVAEGRVAVGGHSTDLQDFADPVEVAIACGMAGADEIVLVDVTGSPESRAKMLDAIRRIAEVVFVPISFMGDIQSLENVEALVRSGADKVIVGSAALSRPALVDEIVARFGTEVLVVSVEAHPSADFSTQSGFIVTTNSGQRVTAVDAVQWGEQCARRGAGGLLLSADAGGPATLDLIRAVRATVSVPIIASGVPGTADAFLSTVDAGADAVLTADLSGVFPIGQIKDALAAAGVAIR